MTDMTQALAQARKALVAQIDALLAMNRTGQVSHRIPGLAIYLLERASSVLAAIDAAQGGAVPKVKALRWPPECPRGQRVYGRGAPFDGAKYCIAHYGDSHGDDTVYRWAAPKGKWSVPQSGYEAAKSAAQADYEQRVLSALDLPLSPVGA